jgi:hypothetical protein
VNLSLGIGNALKDSDCLPLHPRGQFARGNQLFDFGKITAVVVVMMVFMIVMAVVVIVIVVMRLRQVHVELDTLDAVLLPAFNVQMIAGELEFLQFAFERFGLDTEIEQRAEEHVAADAAEEVEIKRFHCIRWIVESLNR